MEYIVELIPRGEGERLRLGLRQSSLGYSWSSETGADLEEVEPQPTIRTARQALERRYLYTYEIYWPLAIPRKAGESLDVPFRVAISRQMLWELRLVAGAASKTPSEYARLILINYLRPGTLPPLDQSYLDMILEERRQKLSTKR